MIVLMDKPLRMALLAIELSEFDVHYCPCTAIKGQVIADFIADQGQEKFLNGVSIQMNHPPNK